MGGMDGGNSAHGRLMVLLSKRVRIVMTNEYRTTKACPNCKNKELSMQCPKENANITIVIKADTTERLYMDCNSLKIATRFSRAATSHL